MFPHEKIQQLDVCEKENKIQIVKSANFLNKNNQNYQQKFPLGDVNVSMNLIKKGNIIAKIQDKSTEEKISSKTIIQNKLQKNVKQLKKNISNLKLKPLELNSQGDIKWKKEFKINTGSEFSFSPLKRSFSKPGKLRKLRMSSSEREALLLFDFSKQNLTDCPKINDLPETNNKEIAVGEEAAEYNSTSPQSTKRKMASVSPIITRRTKKTKGPQCAMLKDNGEDEILCESGNSQYLSPVLGGFQSLSNYKDDCEETLSPVLGQTIASAHNKMLTCSRVPVENELKAKHVHGINNIVNPSQEPSSPVLDSSQYKTGFSIGKKFYPIERLTTIVTTKVAELSQQKSVSDSLSPILDSHQFKELDWKNKNNYFCNIDSFKKANIELSEKKLPLRWKIVKEHRTPLKKTSYAGEKKNSPFGGDQTENGVLNLPCGFDGTPLGSNVLSPILDEHGMTSGKEYHGKESLPNQSQQSPILTDNMEPVSPVLDKSQYMNRFAVKNSKKKNVKDISTSTIFKSVGILSPSLTSSQPLSPVLDSIQYKTKLSKSIANKESTSSYIPPINKVFRGQSKEDFWKKKNPGGKTKKENLFVLQGQMSLSQNKNETSFQILSFNNQNKNALDRSDVFESKTSNQDLNVHNSSIINEDEALSPVLDSSQIKTKISLCNNKSISKTPEKSEIEFKDGDQALSPTLDSSQCYSKILIKLRDDKRLTEPQPLTKNKQSFTKQWYSENIKNCEKIDCELNGKFALSSTKLPSDIKVISPSCVFFSSSDVPLLSPKHLEEEEVVFSIDHQLTSTSQSLTSPLRYHRTEKYCEGNLEKDKVLTSNVYQGDQGSPILGNCLGFDEVNSNSKDMNKKFALPSCNSELDIIQFPLALSQTEYLSSPLQRHGSNYESLFASANKQGSPELVFKNKESTFKTTLENKEDCIDVENNHTSLLNNKCHDSYNESVNNSINNEEQNLGPILQRKSEPINSESRNKPTSKKKVKKKLSLHYKDDNTQINNKPNIHKPKYCSSNGVKKPKKQENDEDSLSGIENLSDTSATEDSQSEKMKSILLNEKDPSHSSMNSINKSVKDEQSNKRNERGTWRIPIESFEVHQDVNIEDSDEEVHNQNNSVDVDKINSVKKNLLSSLDKSELNINCGDLNDSNLLSGKVERRNNVVNLELDFEKTNVSHNTPSAELEIQEDLTQGAVPSQPFQIECSTSPTTKSSEGTQHEQGSGTMSFPPPLNVPARDNPTPTDLLDSACKTRRARVKKGSLVERLRRVVRAQRAEVNMFQHEGPPRLSSAACTLQVLAVSNACTNLLLRCRYSSNSTINPDELSAGEEVVDPDVRVIIDPLYAKAVRPGSTLVVYPPWQSDWREGRGLVLFGVSKLRVLDTEDTPPLHAPPTTCSIPSVLREFHCQRQDDVCDCRQQLVSQLFGGVQTTLSAGPAVGSVKAALLTGKLTGHCTLTLRPLHRFQFRNRNRQVVAGLLCLDSNSDVCQVNLNSLEDEKKVKDLLTHYDHMMLTFQKMGICKRVFVDRCPGLRSVLSQLCPGAVGQSLMYVVSPASDKWLVQTAPSATDHQRASQPTHSETEDLTDARVQTRVRVMGLRGEQLILWNKSTGRYSSVSVSPAAVLPTFAEQDCLQLSLLWARNGDLMIDKFTTVSVVPETSQDSPPVVPPLSRDSVAGDVVLLDSVVTRLQSDASVRWTGPCGHDLLRLRHTQLFYCVVCTQTSSRCRQRLQLDVCVAANSVPTPVRLKVKSETAQVLLLGRPGQVDSDKVYNMIWAIGTNLKCLALVLDVLKNPFGDVLEFLLEEL